MELPYIDSISTGGFNFDNCIRNKAMVEGGLVSQKAPMKTGTTIVGLVWKVSELIYPRMECVLLLTPEPLEDLL